MPGDYLFESVAVRAVKNEPIKCASTFLIKGSNGVIYDFFDVDDDTSIYKLQLREVGGSYYIDFASSFGTGTLVPGYDPNDWNLFGIYWNGTNHDLYYNTDILTTFTLVNHNAGLQVGILEYNISDDLSIAECVFDGNDSYTPNTTLQQRNQYNVFNQNIYRKR